MRRLILEEWLSLDGFAVDKDGKLDFFPASEADKFSVRDQLDFLDTVDTILLGRKTGTSRSWTSGRRPRPTRRLLPTA